MLIAEEQLEIRRLLRLREERESNDQRNNKHKECGDDGLADEIHRWNCCG